MKCDSRTIGREHSEEFDDVTADLNDFNMFKLEGNYETFKQTFTSHHQAYDRTKSFGIVLF